MLVEMESVGCEDLKTIGGWLNKGGDGFSEG
jgi:hypothetical protein